MKYFVICPNVVNECIALLHGLLCCKSKYSGSERTSTMGSSVKVIKRLDVFATILHYVCK